MAQVISSQIGASAVAPPGAKVLPVHPSPIPELHHLKEEDIIRHTIATQIGPDAIAPTADHLPENLNHLEFDDLPAFPENVPAAPLLRLSLKKLLAGDTEEEERLWKASRELGFFYLDLRGAGGPGSDDLDEVEAKDGRVDGDGLLKDADMLFKLGEQVFDLPTEEKEKYDFKDAGSYFGYKGLGAGVIDAKGTKDANEFYNVSKDDILGTGERLPAPAGLEAENARARLASYIRRSHAIVSLILARLEQNLGLPTRTLRDLHRLQAQSGDQVRWVRAPPSPPQTSAQQSLGEHTDFGSVTILFNRLGGLQVLPPDVNGVPQQWCYVKPLRGHCVVNLGDAMVKFSAGVLRSNIHRVVAPPGEQGRLTRMSLVYFARPEDAVVLRALEGSGVIDEARRQGGGDEEEDVTAKDWILRRALGRRTGGDWEKSGGTEGGGFRE